MQLKADFARDRCQKENLELHFHSSVSGFNCYLGIHTYIHRLYFLSNFRVACKNRHNGLTCLCRIYTVHKLMCHCQNSVDWIVPTRNICTLEEM